MKKILFVLPLLMLPLVACNANRKINFAGITDVRTYVKSLSKIHDYTLDVSLNKGTSSSNYEVIFNEDYFVHNETRSIFGYATSENKQVFYFDEYKDALLASSALKDDTNTNLKSIWNNGLFPSFADINLNVFSGADGSTFTIKDKLTILKVLDIIDVDSAIYVNFKSLTAEINDDHNLEFALDFTDLTGSVIVNKIYESSYEPINELRVAGPYIYSDDQIAICDGFAGDNYSELIVDENSEAVGYMAFTKQYYFAEYTEEYLTAYKEAHDGTPMIQSGFIGFENAKIGSETYNGIYLVNMIDTAYMLTYYRIDNPDVPLALTYPKYLTALKSFQYFSFSSTYMMNMTTYAPILNNFYINYQLDTILGEGYSPLMLGYNYENSDKLSVTFSLIVMTPENSIGSLNYYYVDFGTTTSPKMESILDKIA